MKKTLLGCIVVITAGILLNNDYSVLLKILGIILIIAVTKIFEGECY
jgi:hypothetical protein